MNLEFSKLFCCGFTLAAVVLLGSYSFLTVSLGLCAVVLSPWLDTDALSRPTGRVCCVAITRSNTLVSQKSKVDANHNL